MMAAYVIVDITVTDPTDYEEYKQLAPAGVSAYGGKYLARGGAVEILEGNWNPKRLVILEFESIDQAKRWLDSPEYRDAKQIRHRCADTNMVAIAGV